MMYTTGLFLVGSILGTLIRWALGTTITLEWGIRWYLAYVFIYCVDRWLLTPYLLNRPKDREFRIKHPRRCRSKE